MYRMRYLSEINMFPYAFIRQKINSINSITQRLAQEKTFLPFLPLTLVYLWSDL